MTDLNRRKQRKRRVFGLFSVASVLSCLILFPVQLRASVVNFYFQDGTGAPLQNTEVIITPVASPYVNGQWVTAANTFNFTTTAGAGSITNMQNGFYGVRVFGVRGSLFEIYVPNDTNTYSAAQLITPVNPYSFLTNTNIPLYL